MTDVVTPILVSVPAGTVSTSPVRTSVNLGWSDVTNIKLVFPPGCSGLVGARVEYGQTPLYPVGAGGYYILDDYIIDIDVTNQEQGGTWDIAAYNTDYYVHKIYAYLSWNYLTQSQQSSVSPLVSL